MVKPSILLDMGMFADKVLGALASTCQNRWLAYLKIWHTSQTFGTLPFCINANLGQVKVFTGQPNPFTSTCAKTKSVELSEQ